MSTNQIHTPNLVKLTIVGTICGSILGTVCGLSSVNNKQFKLLMIGTVIGTTTFCYYKYKIPR